MDVVEGQRQSEDDDEVNSGDAVQGLWSPENDARRRSEDLGSPPPGARSSDSDL
jgi:hypothetical protein